MFEAGEEFHYYGNDKGKHGSLGIVISIYTERPREYVCKVNKMLYPLYLEHEKMRKIHREPDWEI